MCTSSWPDIALCTETHNLVAVLFPIIQNRPLKYFPYKEQVPQTKVSLSFTIETLALFKCACVAVSVYVHAYTLCVCVCVFVYEQDMWVGGW